MDIYFKDAMTGVLCGDGALIMKSTDGEDMGMRDNDTSA
jgi:hypothetical protein